MWVVVVVCNGRGLVGQWVEADVCLRLVTLLVSGLGEAAWSMEVSRQRPRHKPHIIETRAS